MKEIAKTLRRILAQTAIITTVLIFAILIFMNVTHELNINKMVNPAMTLSTAFICLAASFLIALSNCIFRIRSISLFVRTILHFLACLLSMILTLAIGNYELKSASLLLIIVYAVIYLLIVPPYLAIASAIHRKSKEEDDYDSIFSPRNS